MKILVLCTGNSARSILLEALLQKNGDGRIEAFSAGSDPTGKVNPFAISLLTRLGYDIRGFRSKSWDEFATPDAPKMDLVITVCGGARDSGCPIWPGAPMTVHWGVEDPAAVTGDDQTKEAAFRKTYDILKAKVDAFTNARFEKLTTERQRQVIQEIANV